MPLRVDYNILNQKGTPAFYSDIFANRPAAGFAGRVFISTDTGAIYEDTGSAWTLIADAGAGTTGTLQQVTTNGNTTTLGIIADSFQGNAVDGNYFLRNEDVEFRNQAIGNTFRLVGRSNSDQGYIYFGATGTNYIGFNNTNLVLNGNVTIPSLTTGSVLFSGAAGLVSQDNANLFWDDTNNRLGIGTASPGTKLDIHGTGTIATFNGTGANDGFIGFQNAGTTKWTIGNQYAGGVNNFQIKNSAGTVIYSITGSTQSNFSTNTVVNGVFTANNVGDQIRVSGGAIDASIHTYAGNNLMFIGDTTTGTKGINIDLFSGNTTNSGSISAGGTFICTAGNNSTFLSSYYATTGYSFAGIANTGANLRFGIEGSAGSQLFSGSSVYASVIGTQNLTPLQLGSNATIYATVSTSGNFLIGTTTDNGSKLQVNGGMQSVGASSGVFMIDRAGTASTGFYTSGTMNVFTSAVGTVGTFNMTTGIYTPVSDINRKKDFEDSTIGLNAILALKPTLFRMKDEDETKEKTLGFIAQQVKPYIPQAYVENKDFIGLSDRPIIAALVKSMQEINEKLVRNNIN
jgi:hypothetical protein